MEMTFFGLGTNELLLSIHGLFFIPIMGFASYMSAAIYFKRVLSDVYMTRLKISALVTFLLVLGLMISGILPGVNFGSGSLLTATYRNDYGNFTQTIGEIRTPLGIQASRSPQTTRCPLIEPISILA